MFWAGRQSGFTLIEVMVALTVLAVFLAVGLPAFGGYMEKNRLKSAAEALSSDFHYARSESIMRGPGALINLSFVTDGGENWCYGTSVSASCDCTVTDPNDPTACTIPISGESTLKVTKSTDYASDVSMTTVTFSGNTTSFSATRSLASSGQVSLQADGKVVTIALTSLGRVRICSPSNLGYPAC